MPSRSFLAALALCGARAFAPTRTTRARATPRLSAGGVFSELDGLEEAFWRDLDRAVYGGGAATSPPSLATTFRTAEVTSARYAVPSKAFVCRAVRKPSVATLEPSNKAS